MKTQIKIILVQLSALALIGCNAQSDPVQDDLSMGQEIVKTSCLSCHVETKAKAPGPRADAPPLSTIAGRYNFESLTDDFREHIHVGHADMPDFDFDPKEADLVVAYLKSIQEK